MKERETKMENENKIRGAITVDTERCKGCALCVEACHPKVIEMTRTQVNTHGYAYAVAMRPENCMGCAACGIVCPDGCITVYRTKSPTLQQQP